MLSSAWNELREVVYLAVMVGGLSVIGVGLAVGWCWQALLSDGVMAVNERH